jgi:hypothetical protein
MAWYTCTGFCLDCAFDSTARFYIRSWNRMRVQPDSWLFNVLQVVVSQSPRTVARRVFSASMTLMSPLSAMRQIERGMERCRTSMRRASQSGGALAADGLLCRVAISRGVVFGCGDHGTGPHRHALVCFSCLPCSGSSPLPPAYIPPRLSFGHSSDVPLVSFSLVSLTPPIHRSLSR